VNVAAIIGLNGMMQGAAAMHKATAVISAADNYNTSLSKETGVILDAMATMKSSALQVNSAAKALKEANPQLGTLLDMVT
jgi:hypothetical protein